MKKNKPTNRYFFAILFFCALYFTISAGVGIFLVDWIKPWGILLFFVFEIFLIGISYEATEIILCLLPVSVRLPRNLSLKEFPPVALVMTICDDADFDAIRELKIQTYPNYDVFLLDDSTSQNNHLVVDSFQFRVIRRPSRDGFKAGNLNNWFKKYGEKYKYVVVFDSDSYAKEDYITRIVEYAEHPANHKIAVFQSKVVTQNAGNLFEYLLGINLLVRMWILGRTANATDTLLCFGHNYLARTDAIHKAGYFPESVTAEDTALTFALSAIGYSVKLVDIFSFASEPKNAFVYSRRAIRWGKQTLEMFRFSWKSASIRLKLVLCYHLYSYCVHPIYISILFLVAWVFKTPGLDLSRVLAGFFVAKAYQSPAFITWLLITLLWGGVFFFRLALLTRIGINLNKIFLYTLLMSCLWYSYVFPLTGAMLRTVLGRRVVFDPTNSQGLISPSPSLQNYIKHMCYPVFYSIIVLLGALLRNNLLLYGVTGVWLLVLMISPLILWKINQTSINRVAWELLGDLTHG